MKSCVEEMVSSEMIIMVAMTADRIIGHQGGLPWHIPEDLALFRRSTMGHTLIMGRRTFESIGRPLPGRTNIVVSRTLALVAGVRVFPDFAEAVKSAGQVQGKVFFVGGREIYRQALPLVGRLSVSWIKHDVPGDCRFPEFRPEEWLEEYSQDYPQFRHVIYRRC